MSRIQIENFIAIANERLFQGKQLDALNTIWKEVTHFETCKVEVKAGDRIGQLCGKACIKGKETCMCHQPRPVKVKVEKVEKQRCGKEVQKGKCIRFCVDGLDVCKYHQPKDAPVMCTFQLVSGKRKMTECGKPCASGLNMCKRHLMEKKPVEVKPVEEEKSIEAKPVEEAKPVKVKSVKVKPVEEVKPVEVKPVEVKPVEVKPVEEAKPVEAKPVEVKSVEAKPIEVKSVETKPIEVKSVVSEQVQEENKVQCDFLLKSGARKNQPCGKKCVSGQRKCVLHVS